MWVTKQTGLDWENAQKALKDGLFVGQSIWHHNSGESGPIRIVLDKDWNLITKPAPTIAVVLPAGSPIPETPRVVGKWKPTQPEYESKEWIAFAWEETAPAA